jgi:hypothetical protein
MPSGPYNIPCFPTMRHTANANQYILDNNTNLFFQTTYIDWRR